MPIRLTAVLCSYMLFRFFGPGTFLAGRVLATTCLPPLLPAACEHVRRPRERKRVPYRRPGAMGADVGGGSLAALHGQCGQEQRAHASKRIRKKKLWTQLPS